MNEQITRYWPMFLFAIIVVFTLGGYAVVIAVVKENIRTIFKMIGQQDGRLRSQEQDAAVSAQRLKSIEATLDGNTKLLHAVLAAIRGGHIRRGDSAQPEE